MFIKNLKTGLVQECSNKYVIKHCKARPDEYSVTEKHPGKDKPKTEKKAATPKKTGEAE